MKPPPILMYHAVNTLPDPSRVQVPPERLRQQCELIRRLGLRGVAVRELLAEDRPPGRAVGLTFDDGYADFASVAVPILAEFGFTATVFVLGGLLGGSNEWDRPHRSLMTAQQLRDVHQEGHEIGSHGLRHLRLTELPEEEARKQLTASKACLEEVVGAPVNGYCYPYGVLSPETVALVRETYDYGCGVSVRSLDNRWALPRFHVDSSDGPMRLIAKLALEPLRRRLPRGMACE